MIMINSAEAIALSNAVNAPIEDEVDKIVIAMDILIRRSAERGEWYVEANIPNTNYTSGSWKVAIDKFKRVGFDYRFIVNKFCISWALTQHI